MATYKEAMEHIKTRGCTARREAWTDPNAHVYETDASYINEDGTIDRMPVIYIPRNEPDSGPFYATQACRHKSDWILEG